MAATQSISFNVACHQAMGDCLGPTHGYADDAPVADSKYEELWLI